MTTEITLEDIIAAAMEFEEEQRELKRPAPSGRGRPQQETCVNGHNMAEHGVQLWIEKPDGTIVKNGRRCRACLHGGYTGNPSGRPGSKTCGKGHDMDVHGRQVWRKKPDGTKIKNGRYCAECKRERERKSRA